MLHGTNEQSDCDDFEEDDGDLSRSEIETIMRQELFSGQVGGHGGGLDEKGVQHEGECTEGKADVIQTPQCPSWAGSLPWSTSVTFDRWGGCTLKSCEDL